MIRDRQLVLRLSTSQLERLRAFGQRVGASSLSSAARAAIELGMTSGTPAEEHPAAFPVRLTERGSR